MENENLYKLLFLHFTQFSFEEIERLYDQYSVHTLCDILKVLRGILRNWSKVHLCKLMNPRIRIMVYYSILIGAATIVSKHYANTYAR